MHDIGLVSDEFKFMLDITDHRSHLDFIWADNNFMFEIKCFTGNLVLDGQVHFSGGKSL